MNRSSWPPGAAAPWKPPFWLLAVDMVGIGVLMLGLVMHYAPETPVAQMLPPTARLPLLVIGGLILGFCSIASVMSVLAHRRG